MKRFALTGSTKGLKQVPRVRARGLPIFEVARRALLDQIRQPDGFVLR